MNISNSKSITFKQVVILVNEQIEKRLDNLKLDSNFKQFKKQLSQLLNYDISQYSIQLECSEEDKSDNKQIITDEHEYYSYINRVHLQDYGTIHIFLNQTGSSPHHLSTQIQESRNNNSQTLDLCFEKVHESFEVAPEENEIQNDLIARNSLPCSATNVVKKAYNATEEIIENSELSLANPSLQLSNLLSKQKSSEQDINPSNNGQNHIKLQQSLSNMNLFTVSSEQKVASNDGLTIPTSYFDNHENTDMIENMINYEIIRQILNKFPKLQPDNIEDDVKIKSHIAYFQSQNAVNRRSTSPQPKQKKPDLLSQSMVNLVVLFIQKII